MTNKQSLIIAKEQYIYLNCLITNILDGDTVDATITVFTDLGFKMRQTHVFDWRFRIRDLDTAEIFHPRNDAEKRHGLAAKAFAVTLLQGKTVTITSVKTTGNGLDNYGRYLAQITLPDNTDFATVMKSNGFEKKETY